jgi:hypothetical protein
MSRTLQLREWRAEGIARFGTNRDLWRFQCPKCARAQTRGDLLAKGMGACNAGRVAGFSCIGNYDGTCDYQGGREPALAPVSLVVSDGEVRPTMEFAT